MLASALALGVIYSSCHAPWLCHPGIANLGERRLQHYGFLGTFRAPQHCLQDDQHDNRVLHGVQLSQLCSSAAAMEQEASSKVDICTEATTHAAMSKKTLSQLQSMTSSTVQSSAEGLPTASWILNHLTSSVEMPLWFLVSDDAGV